MTVLEVGGTMVGLPEIIAQNGAPVQPLLLVK
jgi:hypothetical protein